MSIASRTLPILRGLALRTVALLALAGPCPAQQTVAPEPLRRAVEYLAAEVPRWSRENHCFSCHNNGDGARALYTALQRGQDFPPGVLEDTTRWLQNPSGWDTGPANPAFSDRKLSRIQFAAALTAAFEAGQITGQVAGQRVLVVAAESQLPFQEPDGSWQVDAGAMIGSPATYGPVLATYMARQSLERADAARFAEPIARATRWLRAARPAKSNLDTATLAMALPADDARRMQLFDALIRAQNADGGWGPHAEMPSEPFDTAMAVLALAQSPVQSDDAAGREAARRGRAFLIERQLPSGGWPETTRPSGGQSYAQHISTSAWATLALLAPIPQ